VHGGKGCGNAGDWSQNLALAMSYVRLKGGKCIGFAGFDGGAFKDLCNACIVVPKDSTPLRGGIPRRPAGILIVFRLQRAHRRTWKP